MGLFLILIYTYFYQRLPQCGAHAFTSDAKYVIACASLKISVSIVLLRLRWESRKCTRR